MGGGRDLDIDNLNWMLNGPKIVIISYLPHQPIGNKNVSLKPL